MRYLGKRLFKKKNNNFIMKIKERNREPEKKIEYLEIFKFRFYERKLPGRMEQKILEGLNITLQMR